LSWQDLFPVFSFLFLKGKCRYCKKSISWQYPIVELTAGLLFLLIFNFQFFPIASLSRILDGYAVGTIFQFLNLIFLFYITSALIIIFIYDFKHYLIPDKALFPAIAIAFFYRLFEIFNFGHRDLFGIWSLGFGFFAPLLTYFFAILISSGLFLLIFLISKGRAMGFGDVKLAVLMGLLLGFPNVLVALFLAFLFGAIIGVILMVLEKKSLKSEIPFGPFLITGTFMALFWGQQIINWYLHVFLF